MWPNTSLLSIIFIIHKWATLESIKRFTLTLLGEARMLRLTKKERKCSKWERNGRKEGSLTGGGGEAEGKAEGKAEGEEVGAPYGTLEREKIRGVDY